MRQLEAPSESSSRADQAPYGLPLSGNGELRRLALCLALLADAAGAALFLLLVHLPPAGTAGG